MQHTSHYLSELLSSLDEGEIRILRDLKLPLREKALLDFYLNRIGNANPQKKEIEVALSMSRAHIDKTSSLLLGKCYNALVGDDRVALWTFFRQKHLPRHLYHDLHLREREPLALNNTNDLAEFYAEAFEQIHSLTYQDYDAEVAKRYKDRYFEVRTDVSAADRLMIEGRYIRQRITNSLALGRITDEVRSLDATLAELEALLDAESAPVPTVQFYLACAQFYKVISINEEKQRDYLERSLAIVNAQPDEFAIEDIPVLHLKIADTYYQESDFAKAYSIYVNIFSRHAELLTVHFFHSTSYAQLAILNEKYDEAKAILDEYYAPYLTPASEGQLSVMASITSAKRCLADHLPDEAWKHIQHGFTANDKGLFVNFEIELRKLETIYFIQKGDIAFAEELIEKHIKYLQSKKISIKTSLHGKFFKLLRLVIQENTLTKKLTAEQEHLLAEHSESFNAIYGKLLQGLRKT